MMFVLTLVGQYEWHLAFKDSSASKCLILGSSPKWSKCRKVGTTNKSVKCTLEK